jgi:hypothetical protein
VTQAWVGVNPCFARLEGSIRYPFSRKGGARPTQPEWSHDRADDRTQVRA